MFPLAACRPKARRIAAGAADGCPVNAVDFDGSSDYLTRGADLTGNVDGKQGTISFWVRFDGGDGVPMRVFSNDGSSFTFLRQADNTIRVYAEDSANSMILLADGVGALTTSATWHHVIFSFDLATAAFKIYVDDVNDLEPTPTLVDAAVDYTTINFSIGSLVSGDQKLNGALAELWFSNTLYLDLSVEANRRLFITAEGKPANLGANGELPTGTSPILYLNGDATDFQTNQGTGGDFTVTGALTDASTTPCD